ncbi:hypothetical protein BDV34DRAFT_214080 [Aspergillus parasiticus]|uniref:Uncharacterized protein n=1 Tax=Aspergillus parasiticus TaxID=5067 RepID=A0A5N6DGL5_ASPPA|nr:hypothetical protein BDV34DRAFT_214080 [Aspergillus parasiticus]
MTGSLSVDVILHLDPRGRLHIACSVAPHEIWCVKDHLQPEGVRISSDYRQMIRIPALEAVVIASPADCHVVHTLAAIENGVHTLCEEPVTTDLSLTDRSHREKSKTKVMVGFIQEGAMGDPTVVHSHGAEMLDRPGAFSEYARQRSGIFVDTVVHAIDLTLSFLGEDTRPKAFWAPSLIAHHHELKDCQDGDNAVGIVGFWGRKVAYYYHSCTTAYEYDNCTEIIGTEAFVTELDRFRDAILEGKELSLRLTFAYSRLQIALALSHRT